ncbi:hypothetical protein QTP70_000163 [Hemibagrus guttatus]|uniref:Uncharacterized protein n=1 Tax=Hemibagrus guttatus TaxID=175788 RepID=A0AAE0UR08_9TELE|nr:hypothetical protein QTP70_000163 [Hemibagrus guttatus]
MVSGPECITAECEEACPEANHKDEAGSSVKKTPGVGSEEVHQVCNEAGSFEDETSPPEISFIPSVRKLQQETELESYKESLLYKTRMWAKTHIGDILENYALYREKEEAMMRRRSEYESGGSEGQVFLGSEQDLDLVALIEEDTQCEYDYNSRKYISPYGEQPHGYYELRGNVRTRVLDDVSPDRRPRDHYIDTMNELQKIVDTVTEYLAGREEEISKYEETHKSDDKSKMVDKDKDIKPDEVKEETAVEQGITGVKNTMNSLFSSLVGAKSTGETTDTTTTTTTACSPLPLQSESGISKLLSFIPKSNGSPTPIAVVPPAHQELSADKKFPLQSLLPPQSTENNHPVNEVVTDTATSPETQGSTASQPQSVVDSVLGRLSPFRIFGDKQAGEATQSEAPNKSHENTESKEALMDKAKALSIEQSASQPEHQSSCGGSCSGSVELLPETESSGEIPDVPKETTLKPEENPTAQKTADDTGFFSPFKKSLTSFMTSPAHVTKTAESPSGNSVFSIFKPAEASKPEDVPASGTIGDKVKLSFFSSDTPATPQAPKQESGLLSGLLKLGPGEDATTSKNVSNTSTKSPLLSRALLLESVPKGNTDTGWFSNLFKMSPTESPKPQAVAKFPSKPAATMNIPTVVVAPETVEDSSTVSKDTAQEEQMAQEDTTPKTDNQSFPESLTDTGNEERCIKTETQADPLEQQDQAQPEEEEEEEAMSQPQDTLTVSGGNRTSDKPQEENDEIPEDKTITPFDVTHDQITEKSETESKTVEHLTEGQPQPQKQESLESEKPLDFEQKGLELDTGKETGSHTYFVETSEVEKHEESLQPEKADESDEAIKVEMPQKLNKPADYVSHTKTSEIPGTLEESQDRELVDHKILTETDEIPEKLEESMDKDQDKLEKVWFVADSEADHTEQPKNDLCDGVVEKKPAQLKEQETAEKPSTDVPAQMVSEPLSAVIIQPQPRSLPEMIGPLDRPKPRMVESPDQLRLERQGPHKTSRSPEPSTFSGFMSMFSGPSASSKPATSSFFTSPQPSFFKLQPTGGTRTQQQQKTSFFNLPTNLSAGLSTETLTGDLFGLLKSKDVSRPEVTRSTVETSKLKTEDHEGATNINKPSSFGKESGKDREPGAVALGQEQVKVCERSDIETVEEAGSGDVEITEMPINFNESEEGAMKEESSVALTSLFPTDKIITQEKPPSSPTAKIMFDLPALSAPSFGGLLSGAAETAKPFSSLFGSSSETKLPQQPSDSGSLFASLKGFSAGLFQEEKSAVLNEEPISTPSIFGKKLGFPLQSPAAYQTPSTVITTQVENRTDIRESDIEILSLASDVTESQDSSDTEGPSDTLSDKQQSFDSSPESLLAVKQDMSKPGEENEDDPFLTQKDWDATDHALGQLPESPLKKEHSRRLNNHTETCKPQHQTKMNPADRSRFGSSGNLSQASSQFSSEPEERSDPESQIRSPVSTRPRLSSQEVEKGERESRTSGQEKRKENVLPVQAESSFKIDSPPLASSRLRWLKAINKVRVHLHQDHHDDDDDDDDDDERKRNEVRMKEFTDEESEFRVSPPVLQLKS